jgi:hypothetical protein
MQSARQAPVERRGIRALVPPFAVWSSFRGAFLNLLLFGIAAVAGVWLVHQTEYRIEYGARVYAVLNGSAHRVYLEPVGLALLVLLASLLAATFAALRLAGHGRERILDRLSPRLAERMRWADSRFSAKSVAGTALVLALFQTALYALQENVELASIGGGWAGSAVLFAPQHRTVLLLHAVVAVCSSIVLWTFVAIFKSSRQATKFVRLLARIAGLGSRQPVQQSPVPVRLPDLRPIAGTTNPRAPPLAA